MADDGGGGGLSIILQFEACKLGIIWIMHSCYLWNEMRNVLWHLNMLHFYICEYTHTHTHTTILWECICFLFNELSKQHRNSNDSKTSNTLAHITSTCFCRSFFQFFSKLYATLQKHFGWLAGWLTSCFFVLLCYGDENSFGAQQFSHRSESKSFWHF